MSITVSLPTATQYYNLYTLSGFATTTSLIIQNNTSSPLFVIQKSTQPTGDVGTVVPVGQDILVNGSSDTIWVKGTTGPIVVQSMLAQNNSDFSTVDLPHDVWTSSKEKYRRLRVDIGQTGFFEGREFRTFKELNIPVATSLVIKFTALVDFILFEQSLVIDAGSCRFTAITGGTEGGTFSEVLPVIGKNRLTARPTPYYTAQNSLTAGGTITGGTIVEVVRVVTANATAQQQTVGGSQDSARGLPAGTYYLKIENIGTGSVTGVYSLAWEERD